VGIQILFITNMGWFDSVSNSFKKAANTVSNEVKQDYNKTVKWVDQAKTDVKTEVKKDTTKVTSTVKQTEKQVEKKITKAANDTSKWTQQAAKDTGNAFKGAANKTKDFVSKTYQDVKTGINDGNAIGDKASKDIPPDTSDSLLPAWLPYVVIGGGVIFVVVFVM
jgi:hypothetical protein